MRIWEMTADPILESKEVFFHGTSSKFLQKILKMGFIPDPKEKKWSQDTGELASHPGTYFAKDFMTAFMAGSEAARKFGGNPVVFEVQVETRSATWDEDDLIKVNDAYLNGNGLVLLPSSARSLIGMKHPKGPAYDSTDYATPAYKKQVISRTIDAWMHDFSAYRMTREMTPQEKSRLRGPLEKYILAYMAWMGKEDSEHPPQLSYPAELRKERENILKYLPSVATHPLGRSLGHTVRVDKPISYGGKNRILSATEFPNYMDQKSGESLELRKRYGNPSTTFLAGVNTSLTPHWMFIK